nr:hypothetical protein [uncultured Aminipila sp.]
MGAGVIGNLDSQVWKMLGIDVEGLNDKNKNENNETENKDVKENKSEKRKDG